MRKQEAERRRRIIAGDLMCVAESLRSLPPKDLREMKPLVRGLDVPMLIGKLQGMASKAQ